MNEVSRTNSIAIGENIRIAHDNCICIGRNIVTWKNNQILIGNVEIVASGEISDADFAEIKAALLTVGGCDEG